MCNLCSVGNTSMRTTLCLIISDGMFCNSCQNCVFNVWLLSTGSINCISTHRKEKHRHWAQWCRKLGTFHLVQVPHRKLLKGGSATCYRTVSPSSSSACGKNRVFGRIKVSDSHYGCLRRKQCCSDIRHLTRHAHVEFYQDKVWVCCHFHFFVFFRSFVSWL